MLFRNGWKAQGREGRGVGFYFCGIRLTLPRPADEPGILKIASAAPPKPPPREKIPKKLQMIGPKPFYLGAVPQRARARKGSRSFLKLHLSSHEWPLGWAQTHSRLRATKGPQPCDSQFPRRVTTVLLSQGAQSLERRNWREARAGPSSSDSLPGSATWLPGDSLKSL